MSWKTIREVKYLIIHCAATRPDMDIGAEEIRRLHLSKGWLDIGYHYVIRRKGGLDLGRPLTQPGAHARGYNHLSLGICLVGGCELYGPKKTPTAADWYANYAAKAPAEDNFTDIQFTVLKHLITGLKMEYPDAEVLGHRDLPNVPKECPSFDAPAWWEAIQKGGHSS